MAKNDFVHSCGICGFQTTDSYLAHNHIIKCREIGWKPTRREYFAAAALTGLISLVEKDIQVVRLVVDSLNIADGMIELLNKTNEERGGL